jgi:hypothetical protein
MIERNIVKTFYWNGDEVVIRERKRNITEKRAKYYLWNITKKEYISSLYPVIGKEDLGKVYKFDYKGRFYLLVIDEYGVVKINEIKEVKV